ncbi:DNA repair protein RecO [Facklamia miroungae]|uniref:DNA repair protein RecO n=1 Tax=Facklamia miroungae TaxID=120956 RepID=A0A1G7R1R7_9LACT|nr:DNA repair protein RecO [Facklamia miroungae]NKZ29149.1 DNA repair protein RecO [Facklamia miroungae]SDG04678.1 DNA replication and repair protein RecO [Facklamia miroungae]
MNEKFTGIVLFIRPHREKDSLVKIFTHEYGTKMFFVRGLQSLNHPLKKHLIPLTEHEYLGTIHQQGLSFLKEGHTLNVFKSIQSDPFKQAHAAYLSQLIDASIEDNCADQELFQIFKQSLAIVDQREDARPIQLLLQLKLLQRFGVQLNWENCLVCGSSEGIMDFSMAHQGVLCQKHLEVDPNRMHLSQKQIKILQLFSHLNLSQLGHVDISDNTYRRINEVIFEIYHELVGIKLKGESYLNQLYKVADQLMPSKVKGS